MLKIPLFVLVLQIGFNAALNSRGYRGSPLIPSPHFINTGQTRRFPDYYRGLSSRGIPASDSEQSDSEYSSFEDYGFRSVRPLQRHPYLRRNDNVRYKNRLDNDVSLESVPVGRSDSNSYSSDSLQFSSSLSHQTDSTDGRRPYLRHRPSNLRQSQTRKIYRKANDDLSLEVSSIETSNRRDQNPKYFRTGDNLSLEVSPIDKLSADEDAINSLPSFPYQRRNNHIEYENQGYDSYFDLDASSRAKDIHDAYIDTILLVTDDEISDEITRSNLENHEPTDHSNNILNNRRLGDELNRNDDISNNLSPFRGLKPKIRKLSNNSLLTRRYNRKNYDNTNFESLLNGALLINGDNSEQLTVLRLSSLEDLSRESPLLRSSHQKEHNNRQNNNRNFLRLSLSPDNKLTIDEGVASDLSKLLSETLDELNLVPVNFRRSELSNSKYSRKENKGLIAKGNNPNNHSVLRLGSLDIPNAAKHLLRRDREPTYRNNNRNQRRNRINDDPAKNLVPYHEFKSGKPENRRSEKQYQKDEFPDEFSLDTLFAYKKEGYDENLDINDNVDSNAPALLLKSQDDLSHESFNSSEEYQSKQNETTDALHLEFPWNDQLHSNKDVNKSVSALGDLESPLRRGEKTNKNNTIDTTDSLHLEYPWNDILGHAKDNNSKVPAGPTLRAPQSKSNEQKDNTNGTTDSLHLEFPWNDQLSPDDDKSSKLSVLPKLRSTSQVQSQEQEDNSKNTTDSLHLEFPWNDQLSLDDKKKNKLSVLPKLKSPSQLRTHEQKVNSKDTTDLLHLEYPWNDQLSPVDDKSSKLFVLPKLKSSPQLRSHKQKHNTKDTTDTLHLEFPWNDQLSPNKDKDGSVSALRNLEPQLLSRQKTNKTKNNTDSLNLEFPWNDILSPDDDQSNKLSVLLKLRSPSGSRNRENKDDTKKTTDLINLEFPWNDLLSSDEKIRSGLRSPLLRSRTASRRDKEPKDELKLEFPWNDKTSPDKPPNKKKAARIPDPFYIHPYLRNRNIQKHPSYYSRSYDNIYAGANLRKHNKVSPSKSRRKITNKRLNRNQSLRMRNIARSIENNADDSKDSEEDRGDIITFPLDRRPQRLRTLAEHSPPLVTTTHRPTKL